MTIVVRRTWTVQLQHPPIHLLHVHTLLPTTRPGNSSNNVFFPRSTTFIHTKEEITHILGVIFSSFVKLLVLFCEKFLSSEDIYYQTQFLLDSFVRPPPLSFLFDQMLLLELETRTKLGKRKKGIAYFEISHILLLSNQLFDFRSFHVVGKQ